MSDKLVVDEIGGEWRIAWFLEEDGDYGSVLGEHTYKQADLDAAKDTEDREDIAATLAVQALKPERSGPNSHAGYSGAFYWESQAAAKKALAVANAAIKADKLRAEKNHVGWPEWALTALANGWKAPKGWKP
jgi:hypothetical protein